MDTTPYANSVFEQPWWLDIVAPDMWSEVTVEKNGKVLARLPYVINNRHIKMPFMTQTLGIWMDDSLKKYARGNSHLNHQKEVVFSLIEKLPKHKSMCVTLDSSVSYVLPFRWKGYRIEPTFSYRIENVKEVADIDEKIAGKTVQRHIKAAEKVVVVVDNSLSGIDKLEKLNSMTYARQERKVPGNVALNRKIMIESIKNGCGQIMLAMDSNGIPHSGAFFLYDEKVCYYLIGGQNPEYKNDGSQNLILRKGIDFAAGVSRVFDFEGSNIEGIENFFRQYGGNLVVNYHVIKQSLFADCLEMAKPRIKRLIGCKI